MSIQTHPALVEIEESYNKEVCGLNYQRYKEKEKIDQRLGKAKYRVNISRIVIK